MPINLGIDLRFMENEAFRTRGIGRYVSAMIPIILLRNDINKIVILLSILDKNSTSFGFINDPKVEVRRLKPIGSFSKKEIIEQWLNLPIKLSQAMDVDLWFFPVAQVAPVWLNKPFIVTIHDIYPDIHQPRYSGNKQKLYLKTLKSICHNAKKVITVSEYTKDDLIQEMEVEKNKITTIYHGIDRNIFHPESYEESLRIVKQQLHVEANFFLYIGGFDKRKNVISLIHHLPRIQKETGKPCKLLIVGALGSPDCLPLFQETARYRLFQDIFFLGYIDEKLLRALFTVCKAFVFPSRFEGFGFPILEALACHSRVIAFANSSIREIAGNFVELIPDGNDEQFFQAMKKVIRENRMQSSFVVGDLEKHLDLFTWENAVEKTLTLFHAVIE